MSSLKKALPLAWSEKVRHYLSEPFLASREPFLFRLYSFMCMWRWGGFDSVLFDSYECDRRCNHLACSVFLWTSTLSPMWKQSHVSSYVSLILLRGHSSNGFMKVQRVHFCSVAASQCWQNLTSSSNSHESHSPIASATRITQMMNRWAEFMLHFVSTARQIQSNERPSPKLSSPSRPYGGQDRWWKQILGTQLF